MSKSCVYFCIICYHYISTSNLFGYSRLIMFFVWIRHHFDYTAYSAYKAKTFNLAYAPKKVLHQELSGFAGLKKSYVGK